MNNERVLPGEEVPPIRGHQETLGKRRRHILQRRYMVHSLDSGSGWKEQANDT